MAGLFDDLIPQEPQANAPAPAQSNPFTDLIPAQSDPVPLPVPRPQQSAMDKLLGVNGPRYQLWPEKLARGILSSAESAFTLPHDVMTEAEQPKSQISDSDASVLSTPRAMDFAGAASPISPTARSGEFTTLIGSKMAKDAPKPPTAEALQTAAGQGYDAARNSVIQIKPDAVTSMANQVRSSLEQDGIFDQLAPKTFSIINKASGAPDGSFATVANMEALRRSLQLAARDFNNPTEQLAASRAIQRVDQFLGGLSSKDVLAGSPSAAPGVVALPPPVSSAGGGPENVAGILNTARANYAAAMRSNDLTGTLDRANTGILERAENRAQAANSGRNLDNTIRQKIASLLEKPKAVSGFNDQELGALNNVVAGEPVRNSARYIGNLLGGGGGIGQSLVAGAAGAGAGAAMGSPVIGAAVGATPVVVGSAAKAVANALAKRSLNKADELVRSNSPLYQDMLNNAPIIPQNLASRAAVAKALLMSALGQQQ